MAVRHQYEHRVTRRRNILILGLYSLGMCPLSTYVQFGFDEYVSNVICNKLLSVGILVSFISFAAENKMVII